MDVAPPRASCAGVHRTEPGRSVRATSWRAILTVGILVALGLEGVRETLHERRLVRETREPMREGLQNDRQVYEVSMDHRSDEMGEAIEAALNGTR